MPEELLISSWVDCYNGEVGYELQPADVKSDARGISLISFISIAKDRSIISSSKSTLKQIQFTRRYRFCLAIDIWHYRIFHARPLLSSRMGNRAYFGSEQGCLLLYGCVKH